MTLPADQLEVASLREEEERTYGAAAVRAMLKGAGADECHDCGDTIPSDRRKAAPWAVRCVYCQEVSEVGRR